VPDPAGSTVEMSVDSSPGDGAAELVVVHHGVHGSDAVLLGLVWDYLLERAAAVAAGDDPAPLPWAPMFDERAANAAAQAAADRRSLAEFEARRWGGVPPTDRLRALPANTIGLALLDRGLLDALADAPPHVQRRVAVWAARQACKIAGLAAIDWIAAALNTLDRGDPLPRPFQDDQQPWEWMSTDERVPITMVTIPTGTPNCSQQHIALPAIRAATHDDPLAAAVDTVYFAALAHGEDHRHLLTAALTHIDSDT
jgi:hypothetical protein